MRVTIGCVRWAHARCGSRGTIAGMAGLAEERDLRDRRDIEVRDVAPGLWLWRVGYPDGHGGHGWEPPLTTTCVSSGGENAVLDPLAPPDNARAVWDRLDAHPPTLLVVLKPDHV